MRRGGFYPAALDRVAAAFPLLTHGLTLGVGGLEAFDDGYFAAFAPLRRPPRFRPSIRTTSASPVATGASCTSLLPLPLTKASARHAAARLREAGDRLERPVAVENITHYLVPGAVALAEADWIGDVLAESGRGPLARREQRLRERTELTASTRARSSTRSPSSGWSSSTSAGHERSEADGSSCSTPTAPRSSRPCSTC